VSTPVAKQLETRNLSLWFGDHKAVEGVTMTIEAKQVTAIIGPSGCGKSTLLRSFNRMHELVPSARHEGEVLLDGVDVYELDPVAVRRAIGMVFQRPNPFPTMSVFDNVVAGLRLNGVRDRRVLRDVAERSLRQAGLWDELGGRLDTGGARLSGGQQQRLCIARALAVEPEVLLMDEPCSALDPISTLKIEDLIRELRDSYTIVIVTHNMQQAARVSDSTAFLTIERAGEPGRLVEFDETDKIFTNPAKELTERYISGRFG
jgi:phosphate transport system ATP-binding protein